MPPDAKRQFNVNLDAELVRAVKQASIDQDQTLSDFVAEALTAHLTHRTQPAPTLGPVTPVPMVMTHNMRGWMALGRALGLRLRARSRDGRWAELASPDGVLALHHAEASTPESIELTFDTQVPLEDLIPRIEGVGLKCTSPEDWGWGRSISVQGDGINIEINEHDPDSLM